MINSRNETIHKGIVNKITNQNQVEKKVVTAILIVGR